MKNKILWENIAKNVIIILLLFPAYSEINKFLASSSFVTDKPLLGSLLVAVSILAVTACFGNFAFTYEKVTRKGPFYRMLAHITTGLLMLLIGLSLEMTAVISSFLIGNFMVFYLSLSILYVATVLYDFWDLSRAEF